MILFLVMYLYLLKKPQYTESLLRSFNSTSRNCSIFSLNKSSQTYSFITLIPCKISDIFETL